MRMKTALRESEKQEQKKDSITDGLVNGGENMMNMYIPS